MGRPGQQRRAPGGANLRLVLVRANEQIGVHPFLRQTTITGVYPPLGLTYLAGAARRAGFPVTIVDGSAENLGSRAMIQRIVNLKPDVVGFTSTTFSWPVVAALARLLRQALPQVDIWLGGPQLSLFTRENMAQRAFDVAVIGEGDETIVDLLRSRAAGEDLAGIPGTVVRHGEELLFGPKRGPIAELDGLQLPAVDLLPMNRYRVLTLASPVATMITTRGCPFRCRFCSQIYVGGRYREHGPERVVEEMVRAVHDYRARDIVVFDETFNLNRRRLLEICQAILDRGLRARWHIRVRADFLDDEMLAALSAAGCVSLHTGIEAGSERIRKLMNKEMDYDKAAAALARARRVGIQTRAYFMIGYPGETEQEIEETISTALQLPLDWATFAITQPAPGTDIYHEAVEQGRFDEDYWLKYTLLQNDEPPGYFTSPGLDDQRLEALLRKAYLRFYSRPSIIMSKAKNREYWREAFSNAQNIWQNRSSLFS